MKPPALRLPGRGSGRSRLTALARRHVLLRRIASRDASSAVEFALLGPVFGIILAGAVDLGGMLYVRINLDASLSSAANYALNAGSNVGSANGSALASNLAIITSSSHAANWANVTVVVNNGPSTNVAGGVSTNGGTAANADSCYCPTTNAQGMVWGAATTCGATCANGSVAGKFVSITATRAYSAIFASYGFVPSGAISTSTTVQTQ